MQTIIAKDLKKEAFPNQMPDGSQSHALTLAQVEQAAARYGLSTKAIEIIALENNIIPMRYARNFASFSLDDQIRLLKSQAVVIGLGGLGGTVVEILARAGVGALTLVDGDTFEDHNLNRQLLSTQGVLGLSKAKAARERIRNINASVDVTLYELRITPENISHIIADCQVVVDCLDNIPTRMLLQKASGQAGIPMVSAAVAGTTAHVTTVFPEDESLSLVYGPSDELKTDKGVETTLGCTPQAVFLTASIESAEALKVLQGKFEQVLRKKLLVIDLQDNTYDVLRLA